MNLTWEHKKKWHKSTCSIKLINIAQVLQETLYSRNQCNLFLWKEI